MVKGLKQNNAAKSETISVSGHSTEAGLDPYDSGDEKKQQAISNAIDNCSLNSFSHNQNFSPPNDPQILNAIFRFFSSGHFFIKVYFC